MRLTYYEKKVVNLFKSCNYYSNGFLRFSFWKRRIKNLVGDKLTPYQIRKLFNNLVKNNYFIRQNLKKSSYIYQFKYQDKKFINETPLDIGYISFNN